MAGTDLHSNVTGRAEAKRSHGRTQIKLRLNTDRIIATRGFGKTRPVATNDTPEGCQVNRRVELILVDPDSPAASVRR